jgi:hypothetical protein
MNLIKRVIFVLTYIPAVMVLGVITILSLPVEFARYIFVGAKSHVPFCYTVGKPLNDLHEWFNV